ncbi:MAG: hypothetical protein R2710_23850 [Acidimicrobiales bacterium]
MIGDGPGLAGGSSGPGSGTWFAPADADGSSPDPYALFELSTDVRPPTTPWASCGWCSTTRPGQPGDRDGQGHAAMARGGGR